MLQLNHLIRRQKSLHWVWLQYQQHRQLSLGALLLFVVLLTHTLAFYAFEHVNKPKLTLFDSLWVTLTTITTVGYGDISASTVGGRWTTILLLYVLGLSLFAWVGSEVVSKLFERMLNRRRGMADLNCANHYLIVHFPGEEKVRLLIERLRESKNTAFTPLVVIADNLEMLPFSYPDVHFIRGSTSNPGTYKRANINEAACAIVLAMDHEAPASDAITAAAVSIIESLNSEIQTVAECVFEEHMTLFRHVKCDQILMAGDMLIRLLVQETQDAGAARAISKLLDPKADEFYSVDVGAHAAGRTFREVMWSLMTAEPQVMVIGYNRKSEIFLNPAKDTRLQEDDQLIVLCDHRPSWSSVPQELLVGDK